MIRTAIRRWCAISGLLVLLASATVHAQEGVPVTPSAAKEQAGATPGSSACANCDPPSSGPCPPDTEYPKCNRCGYVYHNGMTDQVDGGTLCEKSSIDATLFRYLSVGKDYETPTPDAGCTSCGTTSAPHPAACRLPSLAIYRMHRPDAGTGSFGAGVFCQLDIWMNAFHSLPGRGDVLFLHDPSLYSEQQFDLSPGGSFYASLPAKAMRGVELRDAQGAVVTNFDYAATAVATFTTGRTYHFEVVGAGLQARLTAIRDRNGNGTTLAYQHPVGSGVSWASMLKIATITDAYGRTAQVTYAATAVAGRYVISRIDLPTGGNLQYAYDDPSLSSVSRVTHPDGSQSTFTSLADATSQCVIYRMHDVTDDQGHHDRDLYLTTPTWTNPATSQVQNRSANRARLEINGAGEVEYLGWQDVDPASSVHLFSYVYQGGGSLYRFETYHGAPRSLSRATAWSLSTPASSWTWETVETHTTDGQNRLTGTTAADGRAILMERDPICHRRTRTQYPDGSVATATWTPAANPLIEVDALGRTTAYTYDAAENLLSKTVAVGTPDVATWTWTYNARGQVLEARDPLYDAVHPDLHVTTYGYTSAGYLSSVTEAADVAGGSRPVWQYAYNAAGLRTGMTDPASRVTTFLHDANNRLVKTTYADTSFEEVTYGTGTDAGRVVARRDRNAHVTTIVYDAAGRAETTTTAAGTPVAVLETCTYVPGTQLKQSCTQAGSTTFWTYDHHLRQIASTVSPRAGVQLATSRQFDIWSRPIATTDAYGRSSWQVYDSENRLVRTVRDLLPDGSGIAAAVQSWVSAQATAGTWAGHSIAEPYGQGNWVAGAGSATITSTMYTSVWYTSDRFYVVSQPCAADAVLTARVVDLVGGAPGSQAGLMFRASLTATAPYAFVFLKGDNTIAFQWRTYAGQGCGLKTIATGTRPQWLRLERLGNRVTASTSVDGVVWTTAATAEPALGVTTEVGLAVAANGPAAVTATIDSVLLERTSAVSDTARSAYAQQLAATLPRVTTANPPYVIETQTYDVAGQVTGRINGLGSLTSLVYDGQGRSSAQTEAVGSDVVATTQFGYDAAGNRTQVTSPRGIITQYTYTGRNLLWTEIEAVGTPEQATTRTVAYSPTRKPLTEMDALGRITTSTYGTCCDRLKEIIDPAGFVTLFGYDYVGNRTTVTDPLTHTMTTAYDARNRVASVANAVLETTVFAYDDNLTDNAGIDAVSAVAAVLPTLGLGAGADGSAVAITDPLLKTSYELRDGLGRAVARIDALGHATTVTYDTLVGGGLVETAQTDAIGHVTRVRTDAAGHARQQVDALNHISTASFDPTGNQVAQRDALSIGWDAIYDARHRLMQRTSTRVDAIAYTIWTYDLDGNRLSETDALGTTEDYTFDQRNRRTAILDRLLPRGTTRFAYDAVGNLIQISDADNEVNGGLANLAGTTQYAYDARNLLTAEAFPTGQQGRTLRVYGYDGARRLGSRQVGILDGAFLVTPAFTGTVATTTYVYDAANRLTSRSYGDGLTDGFDYDVAGRLTDATSARYATAVQRGYDAAGRLTSESLTVPDGSVVGSTLTAATWSVGYTYLADNSLLTQTYPTGSVVTRTWTDRHELATVSLGTDRVVARSYDVAGRLTTSVVGPTPGLHTEARTYVPGDHLVASIAVPGMTGFGYTYDAAGRKLTETDSIATGQTFGYDEAGRLTSWTAGAAATQSWNLTKVGDWASTTRDGVTETREHKPVHEAVQVGPNILSYDVQGNLTKDEKGTALAWDPENRLIRARVTRDASATGFGSIATYRADALGRRIAKTVDGTTTFYLPAGAQTVVEIDRPALPPSQADIDGAQADGALANLQEAPASGGILPGAAGTVTRINFQPATTATPAGFIRDTGKTFPAVGQTRTNGLSYGWSADSTAQAVARGGAVPLVEFDTFVQAQTDTASASWSIALPNGTYPMVVVAGDALSTEQTNHLLIGGVFKEDLTPSVLPGYEAGNFDGYAVEVTVTDGTLTIAPGSGAYHAKLCFVEIGAAGTPGTLITPDITATLAARIAQANAQTGADPIVRNGQREYIYGSYIDDVVAYIHTVGAVSQRYYPHTNHLYSVAALTDSTGAMAERFQYDAYGKQTITAPGGAVRAKSAVGWDRGFTGYINDNETGLMYARARMYSPGLGRFISRDPRTAKPTHDYPREKRIRKQVVIEHAGPMSLDGYQDGMSLYSAYFIPNGVDPTGMDWKCDCKDAPKMYSTDPNPYKKDETYMGVDAHLMFELGGSNEWGNYVRGCLVCALDKGADMHEAHMFCYGRASERSGFFGNISGWGTAITVGGILGFLEGLGSIKG